MSAAVVWKVVIGSAIAAVFGPALLSDGSKSEPTTLATSAPRIVYVQQTTTTVPPTVWVTYTENAPLPPVSGDVVIIQQRLADLGYKVTVDGIYGPKTEEAVRAFQTDHQLFVDGIVGPVTTKALGLEGVLGHAGDATTTTTTLGNP